jgi:hypothetical protein
MRSLTCACSVARAVYASILNLLSVSKPYTAMAGGMIVLKGDRKTRETLAISWSYHSWSIPFSYFMRLVEYGTDCSSGKK